MKLMVAVRDVLHALLAVQVVITWLGVGCC